MEEEEELVVVEVVVVVVGIVVVISHQSTTIRCQTLCMIILTLNTWTKVPPILLQSSTEDRTQEGSLPTLKTIEESSQRTNRMLAQEEEYRNRRIEEQYRKFATDEQYRKFATEEHYRKLASEEQYRRLASLAASKNERGGLWMPALH